MPIMSFSISESLRSFLKKLVTGGDFKNNSDAMRGALTQLMNSYDDGEVISSTEIIGTSLKKTITGSIMILISKYDESIEKKLTKIETEYRQSIKAKNCFLYDDNKTIVYIVEDEIFNFHALLTQFNQIEDLKNIRYIIS